MKSVTVNLKSDYHKLLSKEAHKLSIELDERVTIASLLYILIDDHLPEAIEKKRRQVNFDDK